MLGPGEDGRTVQLDVFGWFIDVEVCRVEDEAVSRDLVTWLHLNDVSNNEIPDRDGLHGSFFASEDRNAFLTVQTLKFNELVVFAVVVPGGDQNLDTEGDKDEDSFNPAIGGFDDHSGNNAENCKDSYEQNNPVIH